MFVMIFYFSFDDDNFEKSQKYQSRRFRTKKRSQ